jgi:hypothetical protein
MLTEIGIGRVILVHIAKIHKNAPIVSHISLRVQTEGQM